MDILLIYCYLDSSKTWFKKISIFSVSADQEFENILAGWFWFSVSHEIVVSKPAGAWWEAVGSISTMAQSHGYRFDTIYVHIYSFIMTKTPEESLKIWKKLEKLSVMPVTKD